MSRAGAKLRVLLSLVVTLVVSSIAVGGPIVSMPGPVNIEGTQSRRQLWLVPSTDPSVLMRTTCSQSPEPKFGHRLTSVTGIIPTPRGPILPSCIQSARIRAECPSFRHAMAFS